MSRATADALEAIEARHPHWEHFKFEYGWWSATHENYDASYEGEEDGWVDNGLVATGRTLEDLEMDILNIEEEKGLSK